MRGAWLVMLAASGCTFVTPLQVEPVEDAAPDVAAPVARTLGAVAVWRLAEPGGAQLVDDVSGVPLTIGSAGAGVRRVDGGLALEGRAAIESAAAPRVNKDVRAANAVTFEVWVTPANATQGAADYTVVAAITQNLKARNLSVEQRGGRWAARVRTQAAGKAGDPAILGATPVVAAGRPVHLVVTADAGRRVLYVDGEAAESVPSGAGALTWDAGYRIRIGDERSADRHWLGTVWLLAIYDRALDADEVASNFAAGHACAAC
jgi:hypothetical protein